MLQGQSLGGHASPVPDTTPRSPWLMVLGVGMSSFVTAFSSSSNNIVVPAISDHFHISISLVQWVVTGYYLASVCLLLTCGYLADQFGRRRIYLAGILVFAMGALLTGLAPQIKMMLAARVVQGMGSAMMLATNISLLIPVIPAPERGKALGLVSSIVMTGQLVGMPLGGFIADWLGWPWVYWSILPFAALTFVLGLLTAPLDGPARARARMDWLGMLLYASGMALLVWGLSHGFTMGSLPWMVIGLILLVIFGRWERSFENALMKVSLFRQREFSFSLLAQWLFFVGTASTNFILPFLLVRQLGRTTGEAGLVMMVQAIASVSSAHFGGWISDRFGGAKASTIGVVMAAVGYLWLVRLPLGGTLLQAAISLAIIGLGGGIFMVGNRVLLNTSLQFGDLSSGNALHATGRHAGSLVGTALAAALAAGVGGALNPLPPLVLSVAVLMISVPVTRWGGPRRSIQT